MQVDMERGEGVVGGGGTSPQFIALWELVWGHKQVPAICHPNRKHVGSGLCRSCSKARSKPRPRGRPRLYQGTLEERRAASRRASTLRKSYGLSPEAYAELLASQGGRCAICGTPPGRRSLAVDHDHETGAVRALLCVRCNVGLGYFREHPLLLRAAADYIESFEFSNPARGVE